MSKQYEKTVGVLGVGAVRAHCERSVKGANSDAGVALLNSHNVAVVNDVKRLRQRLADLLGASEKLELLFKGRWNGIKPL